VLILYQYECTDPFRAEFGHIVQEQMQMSANLAICDKCRENANKIERVKLNLLTTLMNQAKKRSGSKKFKVVEDMVAVSWLAAPENGPPSPPPGVEMELTFGEDKS